jgi:hypothetical protein
MGMVALEQRIASAYVILFGVHGEITRKAQERGVSRQRVYREHAGVVTALAGTAWLQEKEALQRRVEELQERHTALEEYVHPRTLSCTLLLTESLSALADGKMPFYPKSAMTLAAC